MQIKFSYIIGSSALNGNKRHRNPPVDLSKTFEKEMGGLAKAFMAYKEDWMTPTKIKDDPAACLAATQATIGALKQRLAREDKELYPLVEE